MCSSEDCEKLWFLYKLEGEPKGVSIEQFCIKQGVPYQVFNKWFRDRKKRIVPYTFDKGYRFMRIVTEGYKRVYKVEWKDVLAILESPVIKEYKLKKEIS